VSQTYTYRMIDPINDRDMALKFRRDSFDVSFGDPDGMGDAQGYFIWIEMNNLLNPWSFVIMEEDGKPIGQIELELLNYGGRNIGYVSLFYLIPEYRGKRIGIEQIKYAEAFFKKYGLTEYHLRVSPTNTPALKFYKKHEFEFMMEEHLNHVVWRLRKFIK
jgi:RimJ/RimL family protein N-acetyltransferase